MQNSLIPTPVCSFRKNATVTVQLLLTMQKIMGISTGINIFLGFNRKKKLRSQLKEFKIPYLMAVIKYLHYASDNWLGPKFGNYVDW